VRNAAAEWVWVPPDAEDVTTDEYRVTHYPSWTSVQWSRTDRPVPDLVEEVGALALGRGSAAVRWWVKGDTTPPDTAEVLVGLGFRLAETVDVLALDLTAAVEDLVQRLAVPHEVTVTVAEDEEQLRIAGDIRGAALCFDPPSSAQLAHALRTAEEARRTGSWTEREWLAWVDGEPVGQAGCTLAGDVARLWGGGVLAAARGRGVYRALLAERCQAAMSAGAQIALVKGRVGSSGPILRRAGFVSYGQERCFERPV
jgi:GNAT superfamily N-acetyltransferase